MIVGLAIQKEYNKKYPSDTPLSFDEILKKHVLVPAGVTQFSKHSTDVDLPEGAGICVDDRDRTAIHPRSVINPNSLMTVIRNQSFI